MRVPNRASLGANQSKAPHTSAFSRTTMTLFAAWMLIAACEENPALPRVESSGGTPGETAPTLVEIVLTPPTTNVQVGAAVQFQTAGRMSDGTSSAVQVTYSATGGTISTAGLYTAGNTAGTFRVIATAAGSSRADTSAVTVTTAPPAPTQPTPPTTPPPPSQPGSYTKVIGDDWSRYSTRDDLRRTGYFWWYLSGVDVHNYLDVVPDPTFGKAVRYTFATSNDQGYAPKSHMDLPRPLDKMWLRWRMKYTPGWTSAGPLPSGYANSYKVAFWLWDGYNSRGSLEISNTDQYLPGLAVQNASTGQYLSYSETRLPGSQDFGRVTGEWTDGEWYEFVAYYEKTGATSARQHWWRRKLTQGGQIANNPWVYAGIELSGATTPRVRAVRLGETKNKNNPKDMHISWGPWEVVDGAQYANPWGMPNVR